jgi:hypothetical protein
MLYQIWFKETITAHVYHVSFRGEGRGEGGHESWWHTGITISYFSFKHLWFRGLPVIPSSMWFHDKATLILIIWKASYISQKTHLTSITKHFSLSLFMETIDVQAYCDSQAKLISKLRGQCTVLINVKVWLQHHIKRSVIGTKVHIH